MTRYVLRRLAAMVPVVLLVLVITFLLTRLIPGDPAVTLLGPGATTAQIERLRHDMHLDRPPAEQFVSYMSGVATGDLGTSLKTKRSIGATLAAKLPATLELAVCASLIALLAGIPVGVLAAARPNGAFDTLSRLIALAGVSVPAFLMALGLQWLFGIWLGWLPIAGRQDAALIEPATTGFLFVDTMLRGDPAALADALRHAVLPALVLATFLAATLSRFVRNMMVATYAEDYIRTARAKGLSRYAVTCRHALRNAILPALTVIGIQFGDMLGGAILTETVFAWPGIGRFTVEAIRARDYPAIQGTTLVFAILFLLVSLLLDMLAMRLDPRLRSVRA